MILRNADMKINTYNEPPASVRYYIEASGLGKPADLCEKNGISSRTDKEEGGKIKNKGGKMSVGQRKNTSLPMSWEAANWVEINS